MQTKIVVTGSLRVNMPVKCFKSMLDKICNASHGPTKQQKASFFTEKNCKGAICTQKDFIDMVLRYIS